MDVLNSSRPQDMRVGIQIFAAEYEASSSLDNSVADSLFPPSKWTEHPRTVIPYELEFNTQPSASRGDTRC